MDLIRTHLTRPAEIFQMFPMFPMFPMFIESRHCFVILPLKKLALVLLAILTASCTTVTPKQVAPQEPVSQGPVDQTPYLRIEPEMHTATLKRVGVDESGQFAVSAADDKTARVWRVSDGKQLAVLRPPQAQGREGKLYSVAMSPDGNTVAVGGWRPLIILTSQSIFLIGKAGKSFTPSKVYPM